MRYEIKIQNHGKVSDFIGHNDYYKRSPEEQEIAAKLYKTETLEKTLNGITAVYVTAFDLDSNFIGGICYAGDKIFDYTHSEKQHLAMKNHFN